MPAFLRTANRFVIVLPKVEQLRILLKHVANVVEARLASLGANTRACYERM